jgi:UTP--glucose-1-phosphate uridylyltransferase
LKAVIPAAGLGTRLLPVTKVVPKELIPVAAKPAIQWVLEEAVTAGFKDIIVVTSPRKQLLRHYLTCLEPGDPLIGHPAIVELESLLRAVTIVFVEQPAALGLGDALLCARALIGQETFAVMLPDNVFGARSTLMAELINVHSETGASCTALWRADAASLKDGAVSVDDSADDSNRRRVTRVFPKGQPGPEATDLRPLGRMILQGEAFGYLERTRSVVERDEVPALDGLARAGSLIGVLTAERFIHLGAGSNQVETAPASA